MTKNTIQMPQLPKTDFYTIKSDLEAIWNGHQGLSREQKEDGTDPVFLFHIGLGTSDRPTAKRRGELMMQIIRTGLQFTERGLAAAEKMKRKKLGMGQKKVSNVAPTESSSGKAADTETGTERGSADTGTNPGSVS